MLRLRTEVAINAEKIELFYHHEKNLKSPDVRARRTYRQCWSAIHDILHASSQAPVHVSWPRISSGSRQASIGEVWSLRQEKKGVFAAAQRCTPTSPRPAKAKLC